ncbi:DUF2158 domain-containing protein [Mucilaginibacter sp. PAMB04168]|uniref:DUF2158 domain-containing protein n=1 Tax=Mucilaginibacter sp. PAMB04168 TaxID=3138567 RepID=UPI0031F63975
MHNTDIKIGDVVKLKSGSLEMTVSDIDENMVSVIYWVPTVNEFKTYNFLSELLMKTNLTA